MNTARTKGREFFMFKEHNLTDLTFVLLPPFMGKILKAGVVKPHELKDFGKLTGILSKNHVKKIVYLNTTSFNPKSDYYCQGNQDLISLLNEVPRFYKKEDFQPYCDVNQITQTVGGTLNTMIDSINDDHELGILEKVGYAAHQSFEVFRIANGVYGILLLDVDVLNPDEGHLTAQHMHRSIRDLGKLTDLLSCDLGFKYATSLVCFKDYVRSVSKLDGSLDF